MAIRRRPTKTPGETATRVVCALLLWSPNLVAWVFRLVAWVFRRYVTFDSLCWMLGWVHRILAWIFRLIGRCVSTAIRPLPWSLRLASLLIVLGGPMAVIHFGGLKWYIDSLGFTKELHWAIVRTREGVFDAFNAFTLGGMILGCVLGGAAVLGFFRRRFVLHLLRVLTVLATLYWLALAGVLWYFPDMVASNYAKLLGGAEGSMIWRNEQWVMWLWACALFLFGCIVLLVCLRRKSVCEYYTRTEVAQPLIGDRIYDNVRTHGKDPQYRTSMYWPMGVILAILFGPMVMRGCGQ